MQQTIECLNEQFHDARNAVLDVYDDVYYHVVDIYTIISEQINMSSCVFKRFIVNYCVQRLDVCF